VSSFKKSHRIVSRKITKFATRRTIEDSVQLQNTANDFLKTMKPLIEQFGSENVFNFDQSGFQLEIHSGRSLSNQGVKKLECVVQSISSTTHSYTIQPIISCNGNLLSPSFIVLQETNGIFGPRVKEILFTPINVIVKASKSGKMTSKAYFPNIGSNSVLSSTNNDLLGQSAKKPLAAGIYHGYSKPDDANQFLTEFINELKHLQDNGFNICNKNVKIRISKLLCDAPAKSFILCTKGHTGFYKTNAELRTNTSFRNKSDKNFHKGTTLFENINIGLVSQIPLDGMHLVFLGVMKKLITFWMRGPKNIRFSDDEKKVINEEILFLKNSVPVDFSRLPRSLEDIEYFKANKKKVQTTKYPLQQICNRLKEQEQVTEQNNENFPILYKQTKIKIINKERYTFYKKIHTEKFTLSTADNENCIMIRDESILCIDSIFKNISTLQIFVTARKSLDPMAFFNLPCSSKLLNIYQTQSF
ncbi:hypothetical protein ALC60_04952, partial [Trachymyrmex zeteki]